MLTFPIFFIHFLPKFFRMDISLEWTRKFIIENGMVPFPSYRNGEVIPILQEWNAHPIPIGMESSFPRGMDSYRNEEPFLAHFKEICFPVGEIVQTSDHVTPTKVESEVRKLDKTVLLEINIVRIIYPSTSSYYRIG